jgi:phosphohistidine phosphatase
MNIYLIRHGDAIELNQEIAGDDFRYLTPDGRDRTIVVTKKIKRLKTKFDLILTSPLVRAVQTAEITAATLGYKGEIITAIELMGGHSFHKFQQLIKKYSGYKNIACFGHAPDVNTFALKLLNKDMRELKINFKKSSVCKIEYNTEIETGTLGWFLNAETMKVMQG